MTRSIFHEISIQGKQTTTVLRVELLNKKGWKRLKKELDQLLGVRSTQKLFKTHNILGNSNTGIGIPADVYSST